MIRKTNHLCELCGGPIAEGALAFRDNEEGFRKPYHVLCRRDAKATEESGESQVKTREPTMLYAHDRGIHTIDGVRSYGWFDVYDEGDNKINLTPVRQATALAFVDESNHGEVTDDLSGDSSVNEVEAVSGQDPEGNNGSANAGTADRKSPAKRGN